MKDKNGIEFKCENCRCVCKYDSMCLAHTPPSFFRPTSEALEARIAELQKELNIVQESERAEALEADKLRTEVKELEANNEVLQRRVQEFSMELLDRTTKENKDVLKRLKEEESEEK